MNFSQPEIWILGILLTLVAWIGNKMVSKMDDLAKTISGIDKCMAVISEKLDKHEEKFTYFDKRISQNENMVLQLRENIHDLRNHVNQSQIKDLQ